MHAIPVQIASSLPPKSVRLNTTVSRVNNGSVELSDGEVLSADHVIVATEEPAAMRLLAQVDSISKNDRSDLNAASTSCLYFEVIDPPLREATLVLNGQRDGVINNLCFPNFAQPTYAPPGKSLLSVSTIDQIKPTGQSLLASVQEQLIDWFGNQAHSWRHLRTYRVPYALPIQTPPAIASCVNGSRVSERMWRCGDYCETGSIEGAIQSGLKTVSNLLSSTGIDS
jgi:predicted NAD/FAD-dependent oxidoreductase